MKKLASLTVAMGLMASIAATASAAEVTTGTTATTKTTSSDAVATVTGATYLNPADPVITPSDIKPGDSHDHSDQDYSVPSFYGKHGNSCWLAECTDC